MSEQNNHSGIQTNANHQAAVLGAEPNLQEGQAAICDHNIHSGVAALTICEALLLAMNDHKLLPEIEIMGVLRDSAETHENGTGSESEMKTHQAVAALINRIIAGGNSVRRP